MDHFPKDMAFCYPWRPYQARVLSELDTHLDDNHLHIVAAPGSGKTVLGLEVTRRLNKPTLIMAPTVAIRDQWIDRLVTLFCGGDRPAWISRDVRQPTFLTVTTYQGLFSAMTERGARDGQTRARLLRRLSAQGIGTLVLDEAHHLRQAWWQSLIAVKESLEEPTVVALTATPPFDVTPLEWDRYVELCGPIDAEIAVPELVREGNLCPHQDLVYLSAPLQSEQAEIKQYREAVENYLQGLLQDPEFIQPLVNHPHVTQPQDHLDAILETPSFYTSVAVFLKRASVQLPKALMRCIGISAKRCPPLSHAQFEILLGGMLYSQRKRFVLPTELTRKVEKALVRLGAADKRRVELDNPRKVASRLVTSVSKLASMETIVRLEQEALGEYLRLVILTDYIRREVFPRHAEDLQPIKRLGVVPIFEHLRRVLGPELRLGILSGSLVVIPRDAGDLLQEIALEQELDVTRIRQQPLPFDENYLEVQMGGDAAHRLTHLVTELFSRGGITTLVGTASLLGEGWDAPLVNTLILASFVGSYMLSNQMRGRAIRSQRDHPQKTANIWHLVCQEPGQSKAGPDFELMQRRFDAFSGVAFSHDIISSGMQRLALGHPPYDDTQLQNINSSMQTHARSRSALRERWERALEQSPEGMMVESLTTGEVTLPRRFVLTNTILALLWQGWFNALFWVSYVLQGIEGISTDMGTRLLIILMLCICGLAILAALPWCLKALWLFLWHAPVASSVRQIGKAVVYGLIQADVIESPPHQLKVVTQKSGHGSVSCTLQGATSRERTLFLDAMQELLGLLENPRYMVMRKTPFLKWLRKDYHSVPKALARNKENAEAFRRYWARYVGPTELIYTRNESGRRLLLHARRHSLAGAFVARSERLRTWQ